MIEILIANQIKMEHLPPVRVLRTGIVARAYPNTRVEIMAEALKALEEVDRQEKTPVIHLQQSQVIQVLANHTRSENRRAATTRALRDRLFGRIRELTRHHLGKSHCDG
jgi:hypothetical protein